MLMGDYDKAQETLADAIDAFPSYDSPRDESESCARLDRAAAMIEKAFALSQVGRQEDAERDYTNALHTLQDAADAKRDCDDAMRRLLIAHIHNDQSILAEKQNPEDTSQELANINLLIDNIETKQDQARLRKIKRLTSNLQKVLDKEDRSRLVLLGGAPGLNALLGTKNRRLDSSAYDNLVIHAGHPPRRKGQPWQRQSFEDTVRRNRWFNQLVKTMLNPRQPDMINWAPDQATLRRLNRRLEKLNYLEMPPDQLRWNQQRAQAIWRTLDRKSDEFFIVRNAKSDMDAILSELNRQQEFASTVLIQFSIYQESKDTPQKYMAHILSPSRSAVTRTTVRAVDIGNSELLRQKIDDFDRLLRTNKNCDPPDILKEGFGGCDNRQNETLDYISSDLYHTIFQNMQDELSSADVVYVVPIADLGRVPFVALRDDDGYLLDKFEFRYLKDAFDVVTYARPPAYSVAQSGSHLVIDASTPDISNAKHEASDVASRLGTNPTNGTSKASFLNALNGDHSIVHIVSHGDRPNESSSTAASIAGKLDLRIQLPLFGPLKRCAKINRCGPPFGEDFRHMLQNARLELIGEPPNATSLEDYSYTVLISANGETISANEVLHHHGSSQLVFLSACETGMNPSDVVSPTVEQSLSLQTAFLRTGAETVVATMWELNDPAGVEFAGLFYENLLGDASMGRAKALLEAQRTLRKSYQHPYFWAPFIAMGNWQEVRTSSSPNM